MPKGTRLSKIPGLPANPSVKYVPLCAWLRCTRCYLTPSTCLCLRGAVVLLSRAWKEAASLRVLDTWGKFLRMPDAKSDGAYASIAGIVQRLHAAAAKQPSK